jgi:hypothetical protein
MRNSANNINNNNGVQTNYQQEPYPHLEAGFNQSCVETILKHVYNDLV